MSAERTAPGRPVPLAALLATLSWPEWRAHPWRQAAALLAVALGVALAFSVHLINASALAEFGSAARSVNGQPDLELRAPDDHGFGTGQFDERFYAQVAELPGVALVSPVVEGQAEVVEPLAAGRTTSLRVLGLDALVAGATAPALLPRATACGERLCALDPRQVFLNAAARRRLGDISTLVLQTPAGRVALHVGGSVAAEGPPLAVMDIAGAQDAFGLDGRLSRLDLRLAPGADSAVLRQHLPSAVRAAAPDEADTRIANLSRAYRVNLTVLALVALFTGAFLVFSVMALSVARRVPQFALLGVLGLGARERLRLVLAEGALLGAAGSALGLALGAGLAAAALHYLGGDLGGGYFHGVPPVLHLDAASAALHALLGIGATLAGSWVPARQAEALAPAQALKGLGLGRTVSQQRLWLGPALLLLALALSFAPPIAGLPIAAYVAVACGLVGGIACVPGVVAALVRLLPTPRSALALLAVERARDQRIQATVAISGVVAALSLGVALTVMVGSFREAVDAWLQQLLPADLYVRVKPPQSGASPPPLPPDLLRQAAALPGVQRAQGERFVNLVLDTRQPPVTLIARSWPADPEHAWPLVGPLLAAPAGQVGVLASEALADLYDARPGRTLALPLGAGRATPVFVRGLWRDYARQTGSVLMPLADYQALTGDRSLSGLAVWLAPGAQLAEVEQALRQAAGGDAQPLEFATTQALRAMSLGLFDRSFAVTTYLQAVAIAIGLFGIAASFSAQVLARRKEFGMLAHLGLTRREVLGLVAVEGAVWTGAGALLGLLLGLAVSVVLVDVVNPQSFHWTMPLAVPWLRLAALCIAVLAAGTLTAMLAGRAAASRDLALAVKEDW